MVETEQVALSKAIQRRTGTTFYAATKLLPARVRHPTYVLYAFFRCADEVVDAADAPPPHVQRAKLEQLRRQALGDEATDHPVLAAFQGVKTRHGIADADVNAFIDAMLTDVDTRRYETYEELEAYMHGSAGAVGHMMTSVMDPDDPERAKPHARALGEAFQLTNFLRDVREDVVDRDRIYLPLETLDAYGVTEADVTRFEMSDGFALAIQHELRRAEQRYQQGVAGIKYLPEDCQLPVLTAAVLYADHHRLIRAVDFDVLTNEPELTRRRLLALVARVRWHWCWSSDPAQVFERASAISRTSAFPSQLERPVLTR